MEGKDENKPKTEIVSIKILHDDNHGGYYVKLNDHHIVDKNTIIIM